MASNKSIINMMMMFREMWPNRVISENTIKMYYLILEHIHDDDLKGAVADCLETCKWFPVPAEIMERIPSIEIPHPEQALEMCLRADNVSELPKVIKRALINVGGLSSLRERDIIQMRRAFLEAYSDLSKLERLERSKERAPKLFEQIEKSIPLLEEQND